MVRLLSAELLLSLIGAGPTTLARPAALDAQGRRALSSFLNDAVNRGDVPGVVVLVAAPHRVLYHEAFGRMDTARAVGMRKDAIFRIASMTKPITSVAVMMFVEQRKLNLNDEVSKYLPAFKSPQVLDRVDVAAGTFETRPATRPITIRHLLTHTSGIGYSWSDPSLAMIQKLTGKTSVADLPLLHEPGEKWTYGAGTRVLGDVVEKLSGQSLEAFFESRIFRPLGMADTGYSVPRAKTPRVVTLHRKKDGTITEIQNPAVIAADPRGDGALFSTAADYCRFLQMILNHGEFGDVRLLNAETVREMGRNQTGDLKVRLQPAADTDYTRPFPNGTGKDVWGLGFQLAATARTDPASRRPGSMGWAGINNTFFWVDPEEEIGVIVLMQMLPFYDEAALGVVRGVETRVYQHLQRRGR